MTADLIGYDGWTQLAVIVASSLVVALLAVLVLARLDPSERRRRRSLLTRADAPVVFLFEGEVLLDATDQARQILTAAPDRGSDWARLSMLLLPRFPDLEHRVGDVAEVEQLEFEALDGGSRLVAEQRNGVLRLTLLDMEGEGAATIDRQSLKAMQDEIATLRATTEHAPFLVWRQTARGRITWVNRAYLDTLARVKRDVDGDAWPPPPLFEPDELLQAVDGGGVRRLSLMPEGATKPLWFDLSSFEIGNEVLFIAADCSDVVQAEAQLKEFRQTLTKTFAQLPIGLAIFDRSRQLALFNPALTDLTRLPVDFLAARPTLFGFLDRLRERKMMPEPKDYRGWRRHLLELEAAAADGTYAETWSLPSGQTYRVTGRPHPDGAVAFLFEDISAEISLTRRFRSELELGQLVIDSFEEAIAVFSSDGVLALSNKAYAALWGGDPGTSLGVVSLADAARTWVERSAPSPIWDNLREQAARGGTRQSWSAETRLSDGRGLIARVEPLGGGATLVGFRTPRRAQDAGADDAAPAPEAAALRLNA